MNERIAVMQVWRFIAATVVVIMHAQSRSLRAFPEGQADSIFGFANLSGWGNFGVDLFFVISGFIMTWTCWNAFGASPVPFWKRRIARVVAGLLVRHGPRGGAPDSLPAPV